MNSTRLAETLTPPKVYQFRIEVKEAEDAPDMLYAEAVADVIYNTEALGRGQQEFRSSGQRYDYDLEDEQIDALYEDELEELKKILELHNVDVSDWDKIRNSPLFFVQD